MKKFVSKKIVSLILISGLLATALAGVVYADGEDTPAPHGPYYLSVSGTVVSAQEFDEGNPDYNGWIRVEIEDADGNPAALTITDRTYFPFESGIAVGDVVTGYFLADAPVPAIWPPQYTAAVLVNGMPEGLNIKADRFFAWEDGSEGMLLSRDNMFAFTVNEDTEIIVANGDEYDGEIEGRRLVVIYGASTRSIPEQATAIKVIALYEDAVPLPTTPPELNIDATEPEPPELSIPQTARPSSWKINVNGGELRGTDMYMIADSNYLKIRDIAALLDGTAKQFNVDFINPTVYLITGEAYDYRGDEMTMNPDAVSTTTSATTHKFMLDGTPIELTAYMIAGSNYVRIHDLLDLLEVSVTFDSSLSEAYLDTTG